jgi:hypothetical protein
MLLQAGVSKIHVCAPSNAAVDEIVTRICQKGLLGMQVKPEEAKKFMLRIGALEYDANTVVKGVTLDVRLNEVLSEARAYDLREQINCAEELLMEIAAEVKI